jgi:hypothetical protein
VSEHQDAAASTGSGKLAGLFREYGRRWEIEHVDPGSAWVAVTRDGSFVHVIAAMTSTSCEPSSRKPRQKIPDQGHPAAQVSSAAIVGEQVAERLERTTRTRSRHVISVFSVAGASRISCQVWLLTQMSPWTWLASPSPMIATALPAELIVTVS